MPQGKNPGLYKIVEKPIVTEKAVSLSGGNKYVFRVSPKTNKVEVRKAIEKLYDVKVKDIRVINVIAKKRQVGRFEGWRSGFKKAIITLEKGFSIEISHS
ncbi:MAG: 50S ribosomal protein L23 [Parcubacteria group bacterium RIFCSPLOWO2_01_FULL_40_65]|nr:MAG: 50S ribosomal protein L23 [Parcubacteria group bacterium RIFCSPHIGHO2_01_FULL_40_30]OHB19887.1 MAG: 50S ribosomal protein L23 [Parcubacteria group bacterium RIFCSPHIGHO2_02_FULL_40_12]OHB21618.1 MAG: 50S ribosomal protein L23 [Parcubacteria group bacterium RIFCSPLOWO2_01_FULL_40_65]OHB23536.1 MAG: 50S ribosomal protein L23 [Parcubacteria group bacterium RIFCSPLOWO2_02_FULL_40_12]OHB24043.1 MAG: 50S ribosomal protein L23 [Parcubacteria group bacterium RIFCSPLOWO2_12_FULL_40_10]